MSKSTNKEEKIPFRKAFLLFIDSIKRVWRFDKKYVFITCFVLIVDTLVEALTVLAVAVFNHRITMGAERYASYIYAYYPILIILVLSVLNSIFFSIWRWMETKSMDKITAFLLRDSVKKAYTLDYASYDDPEFYNKIQKGWSQDGQMFVDSLSQIFCTVSCVIGMLSYISVLTYIDWKLMLVITVLRILFNPFINKTNVLIYRLNNQLSELRRKEQYYRNFFGSKETAAEGKIFNLNAYAKENYYKAHEEIYRATFMHKLKVTTVNFFSEFIHSFPLVIGYIYLAIGVYNGNISLADATLFVSVYVGFVNQTYNTIGNFSDFRTYAEKSRYARDFMLLPTHIFSADDSIKDKISGEHTGHSIEFRNVTFRYPNTEKDVLKNVSFYVGEAETVSIIGANGAGKTTLIHLLMRLYDPTEGIILLDGKDIRNYSAENLYKIYGVLFQDYCNYAISAKESITLSTAAISEDRLDYALRASTAYKFIDALDSGIDTVLSRRFNSKGIELSTGQKQRIALARAYYKDASIIIFDEPSASIDPECEAEIFSAINEARGTKNIWLISHRLSTCTISDRILLLKNGILVGNGNHNDLLKTSKEYKRMFLIQASRYEVER